MVISASWINSEVNMNRTGLFFPLILSSLSSLTYAADLNVGVTVQGQVKPGVYGRIEIGNQPPPPVVYEQPVVVVRERTRVIREPIYLNVPPGHAKNWRKHCHRYNACNRPVYFVKTEEYEPDYKHKHNHKSKHGRDDHPHGPPGHRGPDHHSHD